MDRHGATEKKEAIHYSSSASEVFLFLSTYTDIYSKMHSINDKCSYYLSKDSDVPSMSEFDNVTKSLDKVYKSLVTPTMALMRIREDLELREDD